MEFENVEMIENVDEVMDAIEEAIPEKGFKLGVGEGVLIAALATAAVVGVVALVKKVCANKAKQEELVGEESECDDDLMDISDSDVDDE